MGVKIIIRHVVVPSLTDSEENIIKIKELLKDIKYEQIELLPFKKLCHHKYESLGIEFPMKDTPECSKDTIKKLKQLL
jgi:pyruvate formate lyase activating enzyme